MSCVTEQFFPALAGELRIYCRTGILVSGGADSEILLRAAKDVLGSANSIAFIAATPFLANYYTVLILDVTEMLGVRLVKIPLNLLDIHAVKMNTPERCYHCKRAIYSAVSVTAGMMNITTLADGTNLDDLSEHRPGLRAAEELNITHPFVSAGMSGADVRKLGRLLGMPNYHRPSDSCLATRIPENTPVTSELLSVVDRIEQPLRPHAKSRLRAMVSPGGIVLKYKTADNILVATHRQELESIAESCKLSIAFHENT
jgi:uncharacterized protein